MSRDHGPGADAYTPAAMVKRLVRVAETDDLIEELRRRGRLRDVSVSQTYYEEMVSDEGYLQRQFGFLGKSERRACAGIRDRHHHVSVGGMLSGECPAEVLSREVYALGEYIAIGP